MLCHRQRTIRVLHTFSSLRDHRHQNGDDTTERGKRDGVRHMTRPVKTWLTALGVFAAYLLVAVIVALAFRLHGPRLWPMVILLAVLDLISAGILLWFLREDL